MNNKLRFLIVLLLLLSMIFVLNRYVISTKKYTIPIESVNKNIFKNKLLDDVIEDFDKKYKSTKFEISKFTNKEVDSNIYFYSQIFGYTESYFIIEYNDFEVTQLIFNFSNASKENFEDITEIIYLLIEISDNDIKSVEAKSIILNMFKELKNNKDRVTLVYDNNLVYTLNIFNNNSIRFTIK
ncbi:hypothetical protein STFE110948_03805 [Streptobacillus felis]|uniref:Uncharacterized protein n=1 Tax=Streptobacillus felis TaxID=1384509 RepID=A0A7Z0T791_9FUSO|nr:hypothetical protein [Streptobacillus felis]NYV28041.1 hypothetical protein [Streptobacillus felis]